MHPPSQTHQVVAESVLLDARLALFHQVEGWLAIADLHFGFELSQRLAGRLVPLWGMESTSTRLLQLIADYQPERLIISGDLVHDANGAKALGLLLEEVTQRCAVVAIAGNHDRGLKGVPELIDSFKTVNFEFHHGHCRRPDSERTQIVGHFHPAVTLRDGAGLRLKFPAFVQERNCWILPAFSPWAAGSEWTQTEHSRAWVCTPRRILPLQTAATA